MAHIRFLLASAAPVPPPCHFFFGRNLEQLPVTRPGWPQGPSLCDLTASKLPPHSLTLEGFSPAGLGIPSHPSPGVTSPGKHSLTPPTSG